MAKLTITDADRATADETIAFIKDTLGKDTSALNDYQFNLLVAMKQSSVNGRMAGITASAVSFYLREMGKLAEEAQRAKAPVSTYFGNIGERKEFYATLVSVFPIDSQFGTTYITKMVTREGNVLTWFASNDPTNEMEQGKEYYLSGTVKKHEEYKGVLQTVVTRCTVWTEEGIKLAAEKAAKKAAREAKKAAKEAKALDKSGAPC